MNMERRAFLGAGAASLAVAGARSPVRADAYPDKPLRWVIPFAAAGNYDVTSRIVGEAMGRRLNQTIVMDNKARAACSASRRRSTRRPTDIPW